MKILVTGGAGFIGFHLTKFLVEQGNEIFAIDNINDYYDKKYKYERLRLLGFNETLIENETVKSSVYNNLKFSKIDIINRDNLNQLFEFFKPEVVIHLAAQAGVRYSISNPDEYINSNILGFFNVIENCRHNSVRTFFYASSSSVYGDSSILPFSENENADKPVSLYAASKRSNELIAYSYSSLFSLETIGLRFFTVYGPLGRPDMAYFNFTKAILNDEAITVFNHGNLSRDFTYIDDIVQSIVKLLESTKSNFMANEGKYQVFNIGNSSPVSLIKFIETIEQCIGKKAQLKFSNMQKGDVHDTYSDSSKLFSKINFKPDTTLLSGINQFVIWYKSFHKI
jgi:UDP-glucuronate 4-epimerase